MQTYNFDAIGTQWSIDVLDQLSEDNSEELLRKVKARIETFDKTYSRFRKDSLITALSQKAGDYVLPDDAKPLLTLYKQLYQLTDGAVTPLIGKVLEEAGYDANYSLKPKKLHKPDRWDDVLAVEGTKLTMKKPALLDFGAVGKGYLTDIVGDILKKNGVENFIIDASGDILYKTKDPKTIRVGLEHPANAKQVIGVAELTNGSLCGSAGNRRTWEGFHHIISPHTLTSPTDILAVWVIAQTGLLADALTTCLFFTSAEKLENYFDFEYVIVNKDYTLKKSHDFPGEFFYNE